MKSFKSFNKNPITLDEVVDTSRYKDANDKNPRKNEVGMWYFITATGKGTPPNKEGKTWFKFRGKYSEAEKKAEEWAKSRGLHTVYVMDSVEHDLDERPWALAKRGYKKGDAIVDPKQREKEKKNLPNLKRVRTRK